jgi:hypothetical protein
MSLFSFLNHPYYSTICGEPYSLCILEAKGEISLILAAKASRATKILAKPTIKLGSLTIDLYFFVAGQNPSNY